MVIINQTLNLSPLNMLLLQDPFTSYKEQKWLFIPPPQLTLIGVLNIKYFRDQEIFVKNFTKLVLLLSWDLILGSTIKWLSYNDPKEEYNDENPYIKYRIILVGKLSTFISLKTAENHFSLKKSEFSIQLVVADLTLNILKNLLSRYREGYTINSPLRIKVFKLKLLSDSFNSGNPFPNGLDSTSITNTNNSLSLPASAFTIGDKVAVQVWFKSYNFSNKTRPTFRLLKLQRL